nr:AP2/ERF family transcription factor [Leptolyngbya sp. FACHB-36]
MPSQPQVGRKSVRNTSGIVGVSQTKSARKGHVYEYWQAWFGSGEDRKSVKFSIKKYGATKAKQLAIDARKAWEQEATQIG